MIHFIILRLRKRASFSKLLTILVYFLKRAQIVIADLWACCHNKGIGHFTDIEKLTMFADYRYSMCDACERDVYCMLFLYVVCCMLFFCCECTKIVYYLSPVTMLYNKCTSVQHV
jgi:hypothetical protein